MCIIYYIASLSLEKQMMSFGIEDLGNNRSPVTVSQNVFLTLGQQFDCGS